MASQIAFYRLSEKIVNTEDEIPEDARQVVYYALAIGHHVGVMDCLSELMVVPTDEYQKCVNRLPEGEGRRKLEGVLTWSEIEINRGHVDELLPAFQSLLSGMGEPEAQWIHTMIRCLCDMVAEPAMYLMVKMRA